MKKFAILSLFLLSSLAWSAEDLREIAKKCGASSARSVPALGEGKYFVSVSKSGGGSEFSVCEIKDGEGSRDDDQSTDALWKLYAREVNNFSAEKIEKIDELKIWGNTGIKEPFTDSPEPVELAFLANKSSTEEIGQYFAKRVELIKKVQGVPENAGALFSLGANDEDNNLAYALLFKGIISPAYMSSGSELMDYIIDDNANVEDDGKIFKDLDLVSPANFFKLSNSEKQKVLDKLKLALSGINYATCSWAEGGEPMIFGDKRVGGCGQLCSGVLKCENFLKEPVTRVSVCSADKCQSEDIKTAKGMMACTRDPKFKEAQVGKSEVEGTRILGALILSPKNPGPSCSGICTGLATGSAIGLDGVHTRVVTCSPANCNQNAKACFGDGEFYSKEVKIEGLGQRRMSVDQLQEAKTQTE